MKRLNRLMAATGVALGLAFFGGNVFAQGGAPGGAPGQPA